MTDTVLGKPMDLLPRVSGLDPYASDARAGSGDFARKRRQQRGEERERPEHAPDAGAVSVDSGIDPLLAELDRLRAIDPALTESGAHQALLALRAYQPAPLELPVGGADPLALLIADAASAEPGR